MAQPSSTAPDEEMRSPLPMRRAISGFFLPIILLLLCAVCVASVGAFVYMRSSSDRTYSFPHLRAPGLRVLPVTDLEKKYDLSIVTTLPAAAPGRAARILLDAWSEHDRALYTIDTDGRNLQRLPGHLPCQEQEDDTFHGFTLLANTRMLACNGPLRLYPVDPITLRVTGPMTVSEPRVGFPSWGPDSHQFVTWAAVQGHSTIALYRLNDGYTTSTLAALLAIPDQFLSVEAIQWSPDGRYLSLAVTEATDGGKYVIGVYLVPLSTVEARLAIPSNLTWLPGVPVAQIRIDDFIPLHALADQAYDAVWEPDSSALTVPYGNTYRASERGFGRLSVPDGLLSPFLQFPDWPSPDLAIICQRTWASDRVLVFDLCLIPCTDCRGPTIMPGNDLYVYAPPDTDQLPSTE